MQQQPPPHSAMQQLQVSVQTSDFQHQAPLPPNFSPYPPLTSDSSNAPPATPYGNLDPTLGQNGVQHNGGQAPASAPSSSKKEGNTGEAKARLRKACDVCSKRKVKCDDTGPPCKPCRDLGVECKYEKPSKRRGPPNKHTEANKRPQYGPPGMMGHDRPSSPTHAAETLASISQQQVLSAEAICPIAIVSYLVDDYFTYIHPLVPIPHETSFRPAFISGEASRNTTFLALLASMVGCVAAVYPQKAQQHFQALRIENSVLHNPVVLVERCHKVIVQAQGDPNEDRLLTVHDAQVHYLQGLACAYSFAPQTSLRHFKMCISILQHIGAHKASTYKYKGPTIGANQPRMTPNGDTLQGPQPGQPDLVIEEVTKRTFWAIFATALSVQQSGISPLDLMFPPPDPSDPYPSLPLEVDEVLLTPTGAHPMPLGLMSAIAGFNTSVRIYNAYRDLASIESSLELLSSINSAAKAGLHEEQSKLLQTSLLEVKQIQRDLPPEVSLSPQATPSQSQNRTFPTLVPQLGIDTGPTDWNRPDERKRIQLALQKVNIHHSFLYTCLHLER